MTTARRLVSAGALAGAGVLALTALGSAQAEPTRLNVKLGLWEMTATTQTGGAPPIDTSSMTPEQKARVETMMKSMMQNAGKPHTSSSCLTREKLNEDPFSGNNRVDCKRTTVTNSATTLAVKMECTGSNGEKSHGEARFDAVTPENVKGTIHMIIDRGGHSMTMNSTIAGRYLKADCGDVK